MRRIDRWDRTFILLIVVMLAVFGADRLINRVRSERALGEQNAPTATLTSSPTPFPTETFPFVPPTVLPSETPTPTLTPSATPRVVEIFPTVPARALNETGVPTSTPAPQRTPIAGVGGLIARCETPQKTYQYYRYDLATSRFYALSDRIDSLSLNLTEAEQSFAQGLAQAGVSSDFLSAFGMPEPWLIDQKFDVIGISAARDAVLIHRYVKGEGGLFWASFAEPEFKRLLAFEGSIGSVEEQISTDRVLLQVNAEGRNLYLVELGSGVIRWLTPYQADDAYDGTISPNGKRLAYWTADGIWLVNLDGTFSSLAFPDGSEPDWAADSARVVMRMDGKLAVSSLDGVEWAYLTTALGQRIDGRAPQWTPDQKQILFWQSSGNQCLWRSYELDSGIVRTLYAQAANQCSPQSDFRWSPDGSWWVGAFPQVQGQGTRYVDVLCSVLTGRCGIVRLPGSGGVCSSGLWSDYAQAYAWNFSEDGNDLGWRVIQQMDAPKVLDGHWSSRSSGSFPVLTSPANLGINAEKYALLEITMRVSGGDSARLYFATAGDASFDDRKAFDFVLEDDGEFHLYRFDLSDFARWEGMINRLRLKPTNQSDAVVVIDSVQILPKNP
ncbi:MAG: hypothetical protein JW750_09010 [Anaerolineaceae bacterium]|nr:hypothetical protein [Anaerolineaceae bacterium]